MIGLIILSNYFLSKLNKKSKKYKFWKFLKTILYLLLLKLTLRKFRTNTFFLTFYMFNFLFVLQSLSFNYYFINQKQIL